MVANGGSNLIVRVLGAAAAVAAAAVPFASHVVSSSVLVLALPLPAMIAGWIGPRAARIAVVVCGVLLALALVATTILGARARSAPSSDIEARIREALTSDRLELWNEAERLMALHPLRGVGPAGFDDYAPLALRDPSNLLFWAHNDFLQQGAELGVPGLLLLLGLFAWGFIALWANPAADAFVALAAAALAAVGIQACVDYVLHYPAVALATAALVGAGIAPPHERGRARYGSPSA
jgi:O-antigen ligase